MANEETFGTAPITVLGTPLTVRVEQSSRLEDPERAYVAWVEGEHGSTAIRAYGCSPRVALYAMKGQAYSSLAKGSRLIGEAITEEVVERVLRPEKAPDSGETPKGETRTVRSTLEVTITFTLEPFPMTNGWIVKAYVNDNLVKNVVDETPVGALRRFYDSLEEDPDVMLGLLVEPFLDAWDALLPPPRIARVVLDQENWMVYSYDEEGHRMDGFCVGLGNDVRTESLRRVVAAYSGPWEVK